MIKLVEIIKKRAEGIEKERLLFCVIIKRINKVFYKKFYFFLLT
jgi:hypothetical protein